MLQLVKYENGLVWQMAMNSFWFPSLRCEVYFRIPWIQAGLTLRERLCEFQCLGSGGPAASIFAFLAIVARWPDTTMLWKSWSTVLEDKKPYRGEKRWPSQQLAPITRHENETILDLTAQLWGLNTRWAQVNHQRTAQPIHGIMRK